MDEEEEQFYFAEEEELGEDEVVDLSAEVDEDDYDSFGEEGNYSDD